MKLFSIGSTSGGGGRDTVVAACAVCGLALGTIPVGDSTSGEIASGRLAVVVFAFGCIALGAIPVGDTAPGEIASGRLAVGVFEFGEIAFGCLAFDVIAFSGIVFGGDIDLGVVAFEGGIPFDGIGAPGGGLGRCVDWGPGLGNPSLEEALGTPLSGNELTLAWDLFGGSAISFRLPVDAFLRSMVRSWFGGLSTFAGFSL